MLTPYAAYLKARAFERLTALYVQNRALPSIYIRHVCCFLREHGELTEHPDYKKMYDILMDYMLAYNINLFRDEGIVPQSEQEYRELTEHCVDVLAALPPNIFERYPKSEIDAFMAHLKKHDLI